MKGSVSQGDSEESSQDLGDSYISYYPASILAIPESETGDDVSKHSRSLVLRNLLNEGFTSPEVRDQLIDCVCSLIAPTI